MGLMFFPRGGSAQVTRALANNLPAHGWDVTVVSGSLPSKGRACDATQFFSGLDVRGVDYSQAIEAEDPLMADPPMHPSYEDRKNAADKLFARVDDATYEHLVDAWCKELEAAGAAQADILHLHHLTPLFAAAERVAPDVPRIGHIHGTELLMLEEIEEGNPENWPHADAWAKRMRHWARGCAKLIVLSPRQHERVERLLGVPPEGCEEIANGFEPTRFDRHPIDRARHWNKVLVEDPQGWKPDDEEAGSVSYTEAEIAPLLEPDVPVLLYVGRFTRVKRTALLIAAHARAQERFDRPAPLVLLGGFPASGRTSTRPRRSSGRGPRTSSSPAGTTTRSCPRSSPPRTSWCSPRCASSSGRYSLRGWRAACRRSPSTTTARRRSSPTARPAGWSSPTTRRGWPTRSSRRSTIPPSARGAATTPTPPCASAIRGRRWPERSPGCTTRLCPWACRNADSSATLKRSASRVPRGDRHRDTT